VEPPQPAVAAASAPSASSKEQPPPKKAVAAAPKKRAAAAPSGSGSAAPAAATPEHAIPEKPQQASTESVDVAMLRRSWGALMDHLGQQRQQILRALLESATVAGFEDGTLELAFPPGKGVIVQKVMEREGVLQQALTDMFGISPNISCVVRESRDPAGPAVELVDEDEAPDEKEALRRVQEMLGAKPVDGAGG
jgi:hypothetical protein